MTASPWPALALARHRQGPARVPVHLVAHGQLRPLGSVAAGHLPVLRDWPALARVADGAVHLHLPANDADANANLDQLHRHLHAAGLLRGWRHEAYGLRTPDGVAHATIERAASRFWGVLTLGAHCNGYVADARGRPTHLWIARRAATKPTDPGKLDNLVGGGVPLGQTPLQAVVREGAEEAGLTPAQMAGLQTGGVFLVDADVAEGRQVEWLHVYDLALPPDWQPQAMDGEVAEHLLLPADEALARARAGELTTDATLSLLDFALRHGVAGPDTGPLTRALQALRRPLDP